MTNKSNLARGQLPLTIVMDDAATLSNFQPRPDLLPVLGALTQLRSGDSAGLFIWGGIGVGKSHLLQAVCADVGGDAIYLPLSELVEYPPAALLEGCDRACLVAIDELDSILPHRHWQEALFHLFNRRRDVGLPLLFAANGAPATYTSMLPDLRSRLGSLPVFQLPRLEEDELGSLLQFRAGLRGLSLSKEVVAYILGRAPRSSTALMALLDRLDREALARGRGITVPLINELQLLSRDP